eukprot:2085672-Prymnesium_polylepis.1
MMLKNGADVKSSIGNGAMCMHMMASKGNMAMIKILLKNGADPLAQARHPGETPFFAAIQGNMTKTAEFLISKGANPKGQEGGTALFFCAQNND